MNKKTLMCFGLVLLVALAFWLCGCATIDPQREMAAVHEYFPGADEVYKSPRQPSTYVVTEVGRAYYVQCCNNHVIDVEIFIPTQPTK